MNNTYNSTGMQKICTVIAVDIVRSVSKCLSDSGEVLVEVRWVVPMGGADGTGMSVHPVENSRVLVDTSSGFPFIVGAIPSDGLKTVVRTNIGRQSVDEADIADYSTVDTGDIVRGVGTPRDQRPGDNLFTADGGGLLGLLSAGTGIIKSSPLAQIITSRFGDLVRVVSRNWEHFTDVDETYKVSIRGKVFSIRNIFRTPESSRSETPSHTRYEGNAPMGETVGKDYASYTDATFPADPSGDEVITEYTYNDLAEQTSKYTQSIIGDTHHTIHTPDDVSTSVQDNSATELKKSITGGDKTNWWMNETDFHWDVNDSAVFVNGNAQGIVVNVDGQVVITCGADGNITVTNTGDTNVTTDGSLTVGAGSTLFNLDDVTFNNNGSTTFNSAGRFTVTAPIIDLNPPGALGPELDPPGCVEVVDDHTQPLELFLMPFVENCTFKMNDVIPAILQLPLVTQEPYGSRVIILNHNKVAINVLGNENASVNDINEVVTSAPYFEIIRDTDDNRNFILIEVF